MRVVITLAGATAAVSATAAAGQARFLFFVLDSGGYLNGIGHGCGYEAGRTPLAAWLVGCLAIS